MSQGWWGRRWEAFLDNGIFYVTVAIATGVVAAGIFGDDITSIPLWILILFSGIQGATITATVVLFRRLRKQSVTEIVGVGREPPKHPHAPLLGRIKAFNSSLGDLDMQDAIERTIAATFNRILNDAQSATQDPVLRDMDECRIDRGELYADSGRLGGLRLQLEQIEAIVDHSD